LKLKTSLKIEGKREQTSQDTLSSGTGNLEISDPGYGDVRDLK
jgi:hypothetical protein